VFVAGEREAPSASESGAPGRRSGSWMVSPHHRRRYHLPRRMTDSPRSPCRPGPTSPTAAAAPGRSRH